MAQLGAGSVNRLVFPLTALVLLFVARRRVPAVERLPRSFRSQIPLVVALAVIRLPIYALRNIFGAHGSRPPSAR